MMQQVSQSDPATTASLAEAISALVGKIVVASNGDSSGAPEKPRQGQVLAVGPQAEADGTPVSVGDTVIYSSYGVTPVEVAGKEYLVLTADDVLVGSKVRPSSSGSAAKRAQLRAGLEALRLADLPHGI